MKNKFEINMDDATSVQKGIRFYKRQLMFSIITYPFYIYILYQFLIKNFQNNDYMPTKDDIFIFAKHNVIFFIIVGYIVIEPIIYWPFRFFKINRLKNRLEQLKETNEKQVLLNTPKTGSIRVKINGKEVDVGPSQHIQEKLGDKIK